MEEVQNDKTEVEEVEETQTSDPTTETEARHQDELAAEREEHNRRTGGGAYPLSTEK